MLKFYWNGIKGTDGKLQSAHYAEGPWANLPREVITIYGRRYRDFSQEVHDVFKVENHSEIQTDYFENDHIRVFSNHPLYDGVKKACEAQKIHQAKIDAKKRTLAII